MCLGFSGFTGEARRYGRCASGRYDSRFKNFVEGAQIAISIAGDVVKFEVANLTPQMIIAASSCLVGVQITLQASENVVISFVFHGTWIPHFATAT